MSATTKNTVAKLKKMFPKLSKQQLESFVKKSKGGTGAIVVTRSVAGVIPVRKKRRKKKTT